MGNEKDPPIVEHEYVSGVTVVDIGDIRVARGLSRRPFSGCGHKKLVYDKNERRIWCKDCERDIEAFDAFEAVASQWFRANEAIKRRIAEADAAAKHSLISRAAKAADEVWRSRTMVPSCPHCHRGILPEDALQFGATNREMEIARRKREAKKAGGE